MLIDMFIFSSSLKANISNGRLDNVLLTIQPNYSQPIELYFVLVRAAATVMNIYMSHQVCCLFLNCSRNYLKFNFDIL